MRYSKFIPALFAALALGSALLAADSHPVIPLWPNGAPGFEAKKDLPEKKTGNSVSGIHNPSITVYLPAKGSASGVGVIVAPGGGHRNLVMVKEGSEVAEWFAAHGIAAFVIKNRLANDDANPPNTPQPYTLEDHALADAHRAIRLIRSHATEWGVDPAKLGIIGFSAGGELALVAATHDAASKANATDPIDRLSSRPDFFGLIYPGGLRRQEVTLSKDTPPVFLAAGYGDRPDISEGLAEFYLKCKKAGVVADLHIYSGAEHGFGILTARNAAAATWISRFDEWLVDRKFIAAAKP